MCVVCYKNEGYLLLGTLPKTRRTPGQETRACRNRGRNAESSLHMLKDGTSYQELGPNYRDEKRKQAQIKYFKEQLNQLLGEDSPEDQSA